MLHGRRRGGRRPFDCRRRWRGPVASSCSCSSASTAIRRANVKRRRACKVPVAPAQPTANASTVGVVCPKRQRKRPAAPCAATGTSSSWTYPFICRRDDNLSSSAAAAFFALLLYLCSPRRRCQRRVGGRCSAKRNRWQQCLRLRGLFVCQPPVSATNRDWPVEQAKGRGLRRLKLWMLLCVI